MGKLVIVDALVDPRNRSIAGQTRTILAAIEGATGVLAAEIGIPRPDREIKRLTRCRSTIMSANETTRVGAEAGTAAGLAFSSAFFKSDP